MYQPLRALVVILLLSTITSSAFGQLFNLNPPEIRGQRPTPLITEKNTPITIAFENLRVVDPDILVAPYPQGYTLKVFPGDNYNLVNSTVTPANNFVGTLIVRVQVNDGKFDSNIFDLEIDVTNVQPIITDHESISIKQGDSFTMLLTHLKVTDEDNVYPDDFTLTVFDGSNYSIDGNTIIPNPNFSGKLTVLVSVNDGHEDSDKFEVTVEVKKNSVPTIKDQDALTMYQGKKITIELDHLTVEDTDNTYPDDFTLKVFSGTNYSFSGTTVTPNSTFTGTLTVPVAVDDGIDESKKFDLVIEVLPKINVPPKIDGQDPLTTKEDQSITVVLNNLKVTDPDNNYPDDFTLKIPQGKGNNYTVSGNSVKPDVNFFGSITIPVKVNDGLDDSAPFDLKITVTPVNDIPVITGQSSIVITTQTPTEIQILSLTVTDPDNQKLTLKILPGTNYTFSGNTITSIAGFIGTLTVKVVVNDGIADSAPFNLKVEVIPKSAKPLITGQQPLVVNEDEPLKLEFDDLYVTDEDDVYPDGFTIIVAGGPDYTFEGRTITPAANINGFITVTVSVNDGKELSAPFPLKIYVIPVNDAPNVTALEETAIPYEPGTGAIVITELFAGEDIDNEYLSFAEISIGDSTFNPLSDELIFENTEHIRGIWDQTKGILSLIGYATVGKYDSAIRSIKYNYILTEDEEGNQTEVLPGPKNIYFTLSDGQLVSERRGRKINIESSALLDIPNTFTPNDDHANDTWRIRAITNANHFDKAIVKVYTKRGLLIYESKGIEKSWDGFFNGEVLPVDTYYYTIDLKLSYTKKTYKGVVMILR